MFVGGNVDAADRAGEDREESRAAPLAMRNLGVMGSKRTGDALVEIYSTDKDPEIRKTVINGLFVQGNAAGARRRWRARNRTRR